MRRTLPLLGALAALLGFSGPARADDPVDPGADNFDIRYYINDEDGNQIRQMSSTQMQYLINQARCECGQTIEARVRLINTGASFNNVQIEGYIGTNCALAETSFNPQFKPCTRIVSAKTTTFIQGYSVDFGPIWLGSGLEDAQADRSPAAATPVGSCTGPGGESGVWLCGFFDQQQGCQAEEFFVTGTQNKNFGASESKGITFDYQGPITPPGTVTAAPGDGAVVVSWKSTTSPDVYGYRVLCEEAATGEPAVDGIVTDPGLAPTTSFGQLYFTKENLCPDGPFSSQIGPGDNVGTTGGTDTDGTTTDGTTTDGTTDGTTTDGTTTDASTTDSSTDTTDTTTDGTTTGDTGSTVESACPGARPDSGVCSLKWDYVCSAHIGAGTSNSGSIRVRGLENNKAYHILLVGYDQAGNPLPIKLIENVTPVPSNDLWEQCEQDGNVCGDAGFCSVSPERTGLGALGLFIGLGFFAYGRRTRKTA
ncbi:MAG: hypothetical protein R3B09_08095 [Nannocystaceae bacterium]